MTQDRDPADPAVQADEGTMLASMLLTAIFDGDATFNDAGRVFFELVAKYQLDSPATRSFLAELAWRASRAT